MRLGKLELEKLQEVRKAGEMNCGSRFGRVWEELHHHGYVENFDKKVTVRLTRLTAKGKKALEGRP